MARIAINGFGRIGRKILRAGGRFRPLSRLSKKRVLNRPRTRLTTWPDMDAALTQPGDLIATRIVLLRDLVQSLEGGQFALARNDAEMIARGAARPRRSASGTAPR